MKTLKLILILALCLPLTGCETLTAWQANPNVQFAEAAAIKVAQSYFSNGGNTDTAWGISEGINLIGDLANYKLQQKATNDANQANALAAALLKKQVKAFADDKTAVNGFADGLAGALMAADPKTPAARAKVTLAIANGIQKVTANNTP